MNLPLHTGWLGAFEAGLIAFAIGVLAYLLFHIQAKRLRWPEGSAFGWACLVATLVGAGIDLWHLVPLFTVNPGHAARIRQMLVGVHDPNGLGARVVMEVLGAMVGVVVGWIVSASRERD